MSKNTNKAKDQTIVRIVTKESKSSLGDIFRLGESYTSLILGIIVVITITALLLIFVKSKNSANKLAEVQNQTIAILTQTNSLTSISTVASRVTPSETKKQDENKKSDLSDKTEKTINKEEKFKSDKKIYTVKSGDSLWRIAEEVYKSGYNWVDIKKANNLENADMLFAGAKLIMPDVKVKTITKTDSLISKIQGEGKISGKDYIIEKGDNLWNISQRAYGDGYSWTKIAKANNFSNPNLIHSGNKIIIPR